MALTRKMLTAMGIEAEKVDQIVEAHGETVDGLKNEAKELREQASKVPQLESEIEELKAAQPTEDWEAKYNELNTQFEAYKAQVSTEKAQAEKASLYRAILADAGIDQKRIDAIMKVTDLDEVSVQEGAIVDADAVKEKVAEEWAAFIPQVTEHGAKVPTPPTTGNAQGADPHVSERLRARHERLYGSTEQASPEKE